MRNQVIFASVLSVAYGVFPLSLEAETINIDFSEIVDRYNEGVIDDCVTNGNVSYCDPSRFLYDEFTKKNAVIGDYDWSPNFLFVADEGTYFTPSQFDVVSARLNLFQTSKTCEAFTSDPFGCVGGDLDSASFAAALVDDPDSFEAIDYDFLTVTGSRDGKEVASTRLDPRGRDIVALGPDFAGIDMLELVLDTSYSYATTLTRTNGLYIGCAGPEAYGAPSCNELRFDNLVVDTFVGSITSVPLPAAGWLLAGALGALGAVGARRARG